MFLRPPLCCKVEPDHAAPGPTVKEGCVCEQATLSGSTARSTLADRALMEGVSPSGWLVPLASGVSANATFQ